MQLSRRFTRSKVIKLLLLIGWFLFGIFGFSRYRHTFGFEMVILVWLCLGIAYFSISRWKFRGIIIAVILTIVLFGALLIAYSTFTYWEANQAIEDFIGSVANNNIPAKFSVEIDRLSDLSDDVSRDYLIELRDNYFGEYVYDVTFANGSSFHFLLRHIGFGQWSVAFGQNNKAQPRRSQ